MRQSWCTVRISSLLLHMLSLASKMSWWTLLYRTAPAKQWGDGQNMTVFCCFHVTDFFKVCPVLPPRQGGHESYISNLRKPAAILYDSPAEWRERVATAGCWAAFLWIPSLHQVDRCLAKLNEHKWKTVNTNTSVPIRHRKMVVV